MRVIGSCCGTSNGELKVFKKLISLGLTEKGTHEQRIEEGEGVSQAKTEEEQGEQQVQRS